MVYIIKRNDTLFKIAQAMTGNGSRYKEILPLNPQITNPDFIREGDLLNLPPSWGSGSANVPAPVSPSAPAAQGSGLNNKVLLIAVIAAGAAGAYWFLGRKSAPVAAMNPEEDEDEDHDEE